MSRYTLPTGTTTEVITFSVPKDQPATLPLTVQMGFSAGNHLLSMTGYGDGSNFSDGLKIVDTATKLSTLTVKLGSNWPSKWSLTFEPSPSNPHKTVLDDEHRTHDLTIPSPGDWHVSVTISVIDSDGKPISTGDPKIKVTRPS